MPKIYLSPARHTPDNPCAYSKSCGENKHNDAYLDELEVYLAACGFEYRRNKPLELGGTMQTAVNESNSWGAHLHYISHTNASDGTAKGSRPIVHPTGNGRKWAEIILKHRAKIYPYPMKINERTDLYELNATKAVAIYEEHVFHDNYEDAKWFHENMRVYAKHTCMALCEIFSMPFVDPYVILGDVNRDNRLTVSDVIALRNLIMSDSYDEIADMTKDKRLTVADIIALRQTIMGNFPQETILKPPATPKPPANTNPYNKPDTDLKMGSTGEGVKWVQFELQRRGYDIGPSGIDGIFGKYTDQAVRQFQKDNGLAVDGIVGAKTRSKLEEV